MFLPLLPHGKEVLYTCPIHSQSLYWCLYVILVPCENLDAEYLTHMYEIIVQRKDS
jgi:hypothetical protein